MHYTRTPPGVCVQGGPSLGDAVLAGSQAGELGTFSAPEPASSYLLLSPFRLIIHLCFTLWGWRGECICQSCLVTQS